MNITQTPISDLVIIEPRVFNDERGYFFESYNQQTYKQHGINADFVQDNEALSNYGVIRGLHFQTGEFAQAKLVRVIKGSVFDVAVDFRKNSPTFGQWFGVELSEENKRQFFVPKGFAHGYSVLSDEAIFSYKCDNYYSKENEGGVNLNDSELAIDWRIPKEKQILSDKDIIQPQLKQAKFNFIYEQNV